MCLLERLGVAEPGDVEGEPSLGIRLRIPGFHESLATDPDVSLDQALADGDVTISGGTYEVAVNLSDWPEGDVRVWVSFQMNLANA